MSRAIINAWPVRMRKPAVFIGGLFGDFHGQRRSRRRLFKRWIQVVTNTVSKLNWTPPGLYVSAGQSARRSVSELHRRDAITRLRSRTRFRIGDDDAFVRLARGRVLDFSA